MCRPGSGTILIACAGTSDLPVAEEAAVTAELMGNTRRPALRRRRRRPPPAARRARAAPATPRRSSWSPAWKARCRASSPAWCSVPVIAVPTSVGYGASFGGVAALLGMLNSCANGVAVVNIDNGFGAACMASRDQPSARRLGSALGSGSAWPSGFGLARGRSSLRSTAERRIADRVLRSSFIDASGRAASPRVRPDRRRRRGLAVTPTGRDRLAELAPVDRRREVAACQRATTEGTRFLADHPGFPLRAPADLDAILDALAVEGRALEPLRLLGLADYLESIEQSRGASWHGSAGRFRSCDALVDRVASFKGEIADVRRKIEPAGEVADNASPALASIRERLRRQRAKLRTRSNRSSAAATRRSTCRSRSSPIATAATC